MTERCVWCGAIAVRGRDGVEWVIKPWQSGCEHELLEPPDWA